MTREYKSLRQSPLVLELMREFFVKDETDLNDHAALHLKVLLDPGAIILCLSFVGFWAMLFRLDAGNNLYVRVLTEGDPSLLRNEAKVISRVRQHRFRIVGKREAIEPIAMSLSTTNREEVRIYHAIIDDCGVIPAVLLQPDDE